MHMNWKTELLHLVCKLLRLKLPKIQTNLYTRINKYYNFVCFKQGQNELISTTPWEQKHLNTNKTYWLQNAHDFVKFWD